jgi:hypothetical protein
VQLALLVTKYKSGIDLPSCNIRQRLEQQVDALLLRVVASGIWEAPAAYVQCLGVNVDSRQAEPCPDGWWEQVVKVRYTYMGWGGVGADMQDAHH